MCWGVGRDSMDVVGFEWEGGREDINSCFLSNILLHFFE